MSNEIAIPSIIEQYINSITPYTIDLLKTTTDILKISKYKIPENDQQKISEYFSNFRMLLNSKGINIVKVENKYEIRRTEEFKPIHVMDYIRNYYPFTQADNDYLFRFYWNHYREIMEKHGFYLKPDNTQKFFINHDNQISDIIFHSFLYHYQRIHTLNLIDGLILNKGLLDGSDPGTGKTFCSIYTAKSLNFPFFVICPNNMLTSWRNSVKEANAEDLCIGIVNYETFKTGKYYQKDKKQHNLLNEQSVKYRRTICPFISIIKNVNKVQIYESSHIIKYNFPVNTMLIFDEAHRCKNLTTINTQLLTATTNYKVKVLMLSATIGEEPLKMPGIAKILGLYNKDFEFFTRFLPDHGYIKGNIGSGFVGGKITMNKLHDEIYGAKKGFRMNANDLIKQGLFPEAQILPELINIDNVDKINEIYDKMHEELTKLSEKEYSENSFTIMQKARQQVELLKVPILVEMTEDLVEQDCSVVIFVNFTQTIESLKEQLKTDCSIYGINERKINDENRELFLENKSRVIICNIMSAKEGIDLHDKYHKFTRVSLITPNWSAQDLKQAIGRTHRVGGTRSIHKILFMADTIEERVYERVKQKVENIDILNDGDLKL